MIEDEITQIKKDNLILISQKSSFFKDLAIALKEQKEELNEKHKTILSLHSEKLKEKYKANFDEAIQFYKAEVSDLKQKLEIANKCLLSSNIRKPLFSPGRYSSLTPLDLTQNIKKEYNPVYNLADYKDNG